MGIGMDSPSALIFFLPGVMGPMVAGIVLTYLTRDREARCDYWKRVIVSTSLVNFAVFVRQRQAVKTVDQLETV